MRLPLNNPDDMTDIDLKTLQNMIDVFMERGFSYFTSTFCTTSMGKTTRPHKSFTLFRF